MKLWMSLLATLLVVSAFVPQEKRDWIDPDTGHRVVQLTDHAGGSTLYFHDNAFSPEGDKLMFNTPSGIVVVDVAKIGNADLKPEMRRWALERCTPHPIAVMKAPVRLERFWDQTWNASVIWCKRSTNPPQAHQRRAADRLKARWHELDTGHYPMLSEPKALARLIIDG